MLAVPLFGTFAYLCLREKALTEDEYWVVALTCAVGCVVDSVSCIVTNCTPAPRSLSCYKDVAAVAGLAFITSYLWIVGRDHVDEAWLAIFFTVAAYLDVVAVASYAMRGRGNAYVRYERAACGCEGECTCATPAAPRTLARTWHGAVPAWPRWPRHRASHKTCSQVHVASQKGGGAFRIVPAGLRLAAGSAPRTPCTGR